MDEQAARTELSPGSFTSGVNGGGSAPPGTELGGMDLPHRVAAAVRRLGIASDLLQNLSVASMYDMRIDSSSAGVAEIAGRLIDDAITQLDPSFLDSRRKTQPSTKGVPT